MEKRKGYLYSSGLLPEVAALLFLLIFFFGESDGVALHVE